jgi:hypothetical protein
MRAHERGGQRKVELHARRYFSMRRRGSAALAASLPLVLLWPGPNSSASEAQARVFPLASKQLGARRAWQPPAFRGAEGGGSMAIGGRGGVVYHVNTLSDSTNGACRGGNPATICSLRDCIQASGPRTCFFRIGGTIDLASSLHILHPYVTIAGQSAPGGGVQLTSRTGDLVRVGTHDVIVRFLRVRMQGEANTSSPFAIADEQNDVYNVIFDHCSASWAGWDTWNLWMGRRRRVIKNVSIQWSIAAEPNFRTNGGCNFVIAAMTPELANAGTDIDLHHNLFLSGDHRNPSHRVKSGRIVNNLIYNWSYYAVKVTGIKDVVGNYFKPGPATGASPEIQTYYDPVKAGGASVELAVHVARNCAPRNGFISSSDDWTSLTGHTATADGSDEFTAVPSAGRFRRAAPLCAKGQTVGCKAVDSPGAAISVFPAERLAELDGPLLPAINSLGVPGVGASAKLDDQACNGRWVANRDALDARYIAEAASGTHRRGTAGAGCHTVLRPGSAPRIAPGRACPDADGDGLPDAYEAAQGLNPRDPEDGRARANSGYTHLEEYLNGR